MAASLVAAVTFAYWQPRIADAQTSTQSVVAREVVLVNNTGEMIGRFTASNDGQPQLYLMEASFPENDGVRAAYVTLHVVPHESGGGALLALNSAGERGGIILRTYEDSQMPFIQVYNTRGQAIWAAP
ncbi:MAG: hypothetical protein IT306_19755 [Chloroflexi bacterium]|nr:hypothetical protein [Chloroflexota bacterium]